MPSAHSSGNAEPTVRCALPVGVSTRASGIGGCFGPPARAGDQAGKSMSPGQAPALAKGSGRV